MRIVRRAWNWALSRSLRRLADAHRHFGNLYANRQEHWAAVENYTRALALDPGYAEAYYSRGVLYWRELAQPERAVQDLTRAVELEPARVGAYLNRGLAYKLTQEPDRAIADFERYLTEGTDEFWLETVRRQLAELEQESGPTKAQNAPS